MKQILFDTNIYGRLVSDKITLENVEKKQESHDIIIYGSKIIREELRDTPKGNTFEGKKLRILLIGIYDSLIKKDHHDLKNNKLVETLAGDYFKEYKRKSGNLSRKEMRSDLIIIAIATIYRLDIVVSDDERSMLSNKAIKAYKKINQDYGMQNPIFKKYNYFKQEVARRSSQYDV